MDIPEDLDIDSLITEMKTEHGYTKGQIQIALEGFVMERLLVSEFAMWLESNHSIDLKCLAKHEDKDDGP